MSVICHLLSAVRLLSTCAGAAGRSAFAVLPGLRQSGTQSAWSLQLTIHIVALLVVVLRHRQEYASRVGLGQRPALVERPEILDYCGRNAAVFINYYESLAVSSAALHDRIESAGSCVVWLSRQAATINDSEGLSLCMKPLNVSCNVPDDAYARRMPVLRVTTL